MNTLKIEDTSLYDEKKRISEQLKIEMLPSINCIWATIEYKNRPSMLMDLVEDLTEAQRVIKRELDSSQSLQAEPRWQYHVLSTDSSEVFSLGGDLSYFLEGIKIKNREHLAKYAFACVDALHQVANGYDNRLITISLAQGDAFGGGFETALASDLIVAEEHARFGFTEMMFGMFPGMCAINFLSRRVSPAVVKKMISSATIYTAKELYDMGVVDIVVPQSEGKQAVLSLIKTYSGRVSGHFGLKKAFNKKYPVDYDEMIDITNIWVDTALSISKTNIQVMEYILNEQKEKWASTQ